GRHPVDACCSTLNDIGGDKRRQVLQPKACALHLAMTELPRLHRLCRFLVILDQRLGMPVHDRVFDADALDWRIPECREQRSAFAKLFLHLLGGLAGRRNRQPADAGIAKPGARWMRHHEQVPAIIEYVASIAHDMLVGPIFGRQEVAGPSVMAEGCKSSPDGAGELAGDENAEGFGHGYSAAMATTLDELPLRLSSAA